MCVLKTGYPVSLCVYAYEYMDAVVKVCVCAYIYACVMCMHLLKNMYIAMPDN